MPSLRTPLTALAAAAVGCQGHSIEIVQPQEPLPGAPSANGAGTQADAEKQAGRDSKAAAPARKLPAAGAASSVAREAAGAVGGEIANISLSGGGAADNDLGAAADVGEAANAAADYNVIVVDGVKLGNLGRMTWPKAGAEIPQGLQASTTEALNQVLDATAAGLALNPKTIPIAVGIKAAQVIGHVAGSAVLDKLEAAQIAEALKKVPRPLWKDLKTLEDGTALFVAEDGTIHEDLLLEQRWDGYIPGTGCGKCCPAATKCDMAKQADGSMRFVPYESCGAFFLGSATATELLKKYDPLYGMKHTLARQTMQTVETTPDITEDKLIQHAKNGYVLVGYTAKGFEFRKAESEYYVLTTQAKTLSGLTRWPVFNFSPPELWCDNDFEHIQYNCSTKDELELFTGQTMAEIQSFFPGKTLLCPAAQKWADFQDGKSTVDPRTTTSAGGPAGPPNPDGPAGEGGDLAGEGDDPKPAALTGEAWNPAALHVCVPLVLSSMIYLLM